MTRITKHLVNLRERIARACAESGRNENEVSILAVSKKHDVAAVHEAYMAGLRAMGENYVQEALAKQPACPADISWHYIGRIQSNKTRAIAEHFDWVQTVSSMRAAERLDSQRPAAAPPLNVCVQISTDDSHGGVSPDAAAALCAGIAELPQLQLRGLMTIPLPAADFAAQRLPLRTVRELYESLRTEYALDTLSMGMTNDLEAAIAEGSTMLRIGTALFGPRTAE